MVTPKHDRENAVGAHVGDRFRDLVETLLDVRNGKHVANVANPEGFTQIHSEFVVVGSVEGGNTPHTLRPETCSTAIRGADVKRNTDHSGFGTTYRSGTRYGPQGMRRISA